VVAARVPARPSAFAVSGPAFVAARFGFRPSDTIRVPKTAAINRNPAVNAVNAVNAVVFHFHPQKLPGFIFLRAPHARARKKGTLWMELENHCVHCIDGRSVHHSTETGIH
jgi:hypothetical protein